MQIIESLIPLGTAARPGIALRKKLGITYHETGNRNIGANARAHMLYQTVNGGQNQFTSYHYVTDDKEAYRLIPENEISYHAGDGANGVGNNETISIEICVNADGDFAKAVANAIELGADILKRNGMSGVYSHKHWSGKNCPENILRGNPFSWDELVNRVKNGNSNIEEIKPGGNGLDQVLQIGEFCTFPGLFRVDEVSATRNAFCNYELSKGKPDEHNWIDAVPVTEVNHNGQAAGDQILQVGELVVIPGRYQVLSVDAPTNAVKLQVGSRATWIEATRLLEVS